MWSSAPHVTLCGDRVPSTGHRASRYARDLLDGGARGCVDNGACDAGSRQQSAGAAAAARMLCAVRCACRATACVLPVFDACCSKRWLLLRCVAAHLSGCIKRAAAFIVQVQAAAAARVAGGPTFRRDILKSARNGDIFSVFCHLVADADGVNKRDDLYLPPAPLCPSRIFIIFML